MEFKELKSKTEHELHTFLATSREKLRELRFKDSNSQLKNVREIRSIKQAVARVLTLLRQRKNIPAPAVESKDLNK
jgi:ribosomal protein L29